MNFHLKIPWFLRETIPSILSTVNTAQLAINYITQKFGQSIAQHTVQICTSSNVIIQLHVGMQQYGSLPYCVLPLSVLQHIAVLQYMIKFEKRTHHVFKTCF